MTGRKARVRLRSLHESTCLKDTRASYAALPSRLVPS